MTPAPRARLQELVTQMRDGAAWSEKRGGDDPKTHTADGYDSGVVALRRFADALAACLAAEGEEDMSVQVADYEVALQRAAAIILKLRGCAEDEIDDQLIASLVDHELREPPAPPVASPASPEGE
jgi:hypothetical protein